MNKIPKILLTILLVAIISSISGTGVYFFMQNKFKNQANSAQNIEKIVKVERGDLVSSLNLVGTTKLQNEQQLKFNETGKVIKVYKKTLDKVKKGDLIAEIDKTTILNSIKTLEFTLENSKSKLKKLKDVTLKQDIDKMKLDIEKSKNDLENKNVNLVYFKKEQENSYNEQKRALEDKKNEFDTYTKTLQNTYDEIKRDPENKNDILQSNQTKLKNLKDDYDLEVKNYDLNLTKKLNEKKESISKEYYEISDNIDSIDKSLDEVSELLNIRSNNNNFGNLVYYSAKNSDYKNKSTSAFYGVNSQLEDLKKQFELVKNEYDVDGIIKCLDIEKEIYSNLYTASLNFVKGLNASITTDSFNDSDISRFTSIASSLKSSAISVRDSIETKKIDLKSQKSDDKIKNELQTALDNKSKEIKDLEIQILKDKSDYIISSSTLDTKLTQEKLKYESKKNELEKSILDFEKLSITNKNNIIDKINEIKDAEISLKDLQKKYNDSLKIDENPDVLVAINQIKQDELTLETEKNKLQNYVLIAPFDGIVRENLLVEGESVTSGDAKVTVDNPNLIEIRVEVDQIDIMKFKVGQETQITFDAFAGETFTGSVTKVGNKNIMTDSYSPPKYELIVLLVGVEKEINSGMNANLSVVVENKINVITVPYTAVDTDSTTGENFVTVKQKNNKKEKRKVTVGYSDGTKTEIIEGLKEGEEVYEINYDANSFKDTDFPANPMY